MTVYDAGWIDTPSAGGGLCRACFTQWISDSSVAIEVYLSTLKRFDDYVDGLGD